MNTNVYNFLIFASFVVFTIVLFWIVFTSPFNTQMNGLIVILDCLSVLLATNYLLYRKEMKMK